MATETDTIVRVDPKTLLVGTNVRKDAKLTPEFLTSIKELGVRIPITAYDTAEGLVVVDGQRRTLAAVDQALSEVPVYVTTAPTDQERIIDQVVVNEQRSDLQHAEAVAAVQELALFDMKAPAIAKKLGIDRGLVKDAVKLGTSPKAQEFYAKGGPFDRAVTLAEFEGQPEQAELFAIAQGNQSWQVDRRARELLEERDRAAVAAEIEAAGVKLAKKPGYYDNVPKPLEQLYVDDKATSGLDELSHERVVELAGDELVAWPDWVHQGGKRRMGIVYGVKNWKSRGLFVPSYYLNTNPSRPATPEDAEKLKLERRQARLNTKEWVAAAAPRFEFLQGLVQRKTMPKGWEALVAKRMLDNAGSFSTTQLKAMLTILQLEQSSGSYSIRGVIEKLLEKQPTKALQIMLAVELGCVEGAGDFDRKGWAGTYAVPLASVKAYLKRLVEWGYVLSDFEKAVVAGKVKKSA